VQREVQKKNQDEQAARQQMDGELRERAAAHTELARLGIPYERDVFVENAAQGETNRSDDAIFGKSCCKYTQTLKIQWVTRGSGRVLSRDLLP
jgi:hypothetical protein